MEEGMATTVFIGFSLLIVGSVEHTDAVSEAFGALSSVYSKRFRFLEAKIRLLCKT
jgi:hypothetical protein